MLAADTDNGSGGWSVTENVLKDVYHFMFTWQPEKMVDMQFERNWVDSPLYTNNAAGSVPPVRVVDNTLVALSGVWPAAAQVVMAGAGARPRAKRVTVAMAGILDDGDLSRAARTFSNVVPRRDSDGAIVNAHDGQIVHENGTCRICIREGWSFVFARQISRYAGITGLRMPQVRTTGSPQDTRPVTSSTHSTAAPGALSMATTSRLDLLVAAASR